MNVTLNAMMKMLSAWIGNIDPDTPEIFDELCSCEGNNSSPEGKEFWADNSFRIAVVIDASFKYYEPLINSLSHHRLHSRGAVGNMSLRGSIAGDFL